MVLLLSFGCGPVSQDDVCVYRRNGKVVCRSFTVLGPNAAGSQERMARSCGGSSLAGGTDPSWERQCPDVAYLRQPCGCVFNLRGVALGVNERYAATFTPAEQVAACDALTAAFYCER